MGGEFLCDSYTGIVPSRSISYEVKPFYAGKEAVMVGLLLVCLALVLVAGFVGHDCLRGRV